MSHSLLIAVDKATGDHIPVSAHSSGELKLDSIESSNNQIKDNTQFVNSRLNNIQNKLGQNVDGSGSTAGQMLDGIDSSCNTIESNSTLTASRLNSIQNKLNENTDGTGDTIGELLKSVDTNISTLSSSTTTIDSVLDAILVKNTEIDNAADLTNTKLTAQATHNTNLLTKATEIDAVLDNIYIRLDDSGSNVSWADNSSLSAGLGTSSVDCAGYKSVSIFGKSGTAYAITISRSNDNSNWYSNPFSITPTSIGSVNTFQVDLENIPRYLRIENHSGSTITGLYAKGKLHK